MCVCVCVGSVPHPPRHTHPSPHALTQRARSRTAPKRLLARTGVWAAVAANIAVCALEALSHGFTSALPPLTHPCMAGSGRPRPTRGRKASGEWCSRRLLTWREFNQHPGVVAGWVCVAGWEQVAELERALVEARRTIVDREVTIRRLTVDVEALEADVREERVAVEEVSRQCTPHGHPCAHRHRHPAPTPRGLLLPPLASLQARAAAATQQRATREALDRRDDLARRAAVLESHLREVEERSVEAIRRAEEAAVTRARSMAGSAIVQVRSEPTFSDALWPRRQPSLWPCADPCCRRIKACRRPTPPVTSCAS